MFEHISYELLENEIRFVKDNKDNNDNESISYSDTDEKSVLEKTINELATDCEMKTKYIQKLTTKI